MIHTVVFRLRHPAGSTEEQALNAAKALASIPVSSSSSSCAR